MSKKQTSSILNLRQIFSNRHIVESYNRTHPYLSSTDSHPHKNTDHQIVDIFLQDQVYSQINKKKPHIVQNYMDDEGNVHDDQQPYEVHCGQIKRKHRNLHDLQNLMDSNSDHMAIPSRNSSLSSLGSKEGIEGLSRAINKNKFVEDKLEMMEIEFDQHIGNPEKHNFDYEVMEDLSISKLNAMDLEEEEPPSISFYHQITPKKKPSFDELLPQPHLQSSQIRINNHFPAKESLFPQKNLQFPRKPRRESLDKLDRLEKIRKIQAIGCNCRKSKCLKMYCQCFNLQIFCSQNCNCCSCGNLQPNHNHQKAVMDALTRNPKAFAQSNQKIEVVFDLGVQLKEVKKGCKCRKTKCIKKYCQCFNSGEKCGKFCQCEGCQNCGTQH